MQQPLTGIHQDYVTHTSDSVGRQKVASGDSFIPESDVECSTWLANVMSDDTARCASCYQHIQFVVTNASYAWAPARQSFTCSSSTDAGSE